MTTTISAQLYPSTITPSPVCSECHWELSHSPACSKRLPRLAMDIPTSEEVRDLALARIINMAEPNK